MKAVFYSGGTPSWAAEVGGTPWALLPVGNRPLIEYWLDLAVDLHVKDVVVVLGDGAEQIEAFCGEGERWGLNISYSFLRDGVDVLDYLKRSPERWQDGLFYVSAPVFPGRNSGFSTPEPEDAIASVYADDGHVLAFISNNRDAVLSLISATEGVDSTADASLDLCWNRLASVQDYFDLNMRLVGGESDRYVTPGYYSRDNNYIGYNVVIPASATLVPPVIIGNDCRIGTLASIGPNAVISDHVIVDRQCELRDCVILQGTCIGRNLEITEKIVSGRRLVEPDGTYLDVGDSWILSDMRPGLVIRDFVRGLLGWVGALIIGLVQIVLFAIIYPFVKLTGGGGFESREIHGMHGKVIRMGVFCPASNRLHFSVLVMINCARRFIPICLQYSITLQVVRYPTLPPCGRQMRFSIRVSVLLLKI